MEQQPRKDMTTFILLMALSATLGAGLLILPLTLYAALVIVTVATFQLTDPAPSKTERL